MSVCVLKQDRRRQASALEWKKRPIPHTLHHFHNVLHLRPSSGKPYKQCIGCRLSLWKMHQSEDVRNSFHCVHKFKVSELFKYKDKHDAELLKLENDIVNVPFL